MKNFKSLMKKVETTLAAVSFAEEGEFETAQEMVREERRVLLALRSDANADRSLAYAINLCKRIEADLDVLYVTPEAAPEMHASRTLNDYLDKVRAAGINAGVVIKKGCLKEEIIGYTESHHSVKFTVVESSEELDTGCKGRGKVLSALWRSLRCPLVVVSEAQA